MNKTHPLQRFLPALSRAYAFKQALCHPGFRKAKPEEDVICHEYPLQSLVAFGGGCSGSQRGGVCCIVLQGKFQNAIANGVIDEQSGK